MRPWRGFCARGRVNLDNNLRADGALPADGQRLWNTAEAGHCVCLGVTAATHLESFLRKSDGSDWELFYLTVFEPIVLVGWLSTSRL